MTATRSQSGGARLWSAALASLIPWAAFLLAMALVDFRSTSLIGLAAAAPLYLSFVALPSLLALAVVRAGLLRIVVLVLLTAVAATGGVLVVTTDDAQAGLAVLWVPFVAIPVAAVVWIGQAVAARRTTAVSPGAGAPVTAGLSDRLAALAIDIALVGAVLVIPLTALSHERQEVAAGVVGVGAGTVYMAALVAGRGRTVGQSLLGLAVVDVQTLGRVALNRALPRSLIVVLELAMAPTIILAAAAVAELLSVSACGRSITDRLLRTSVVATR